MFFVNLRILIFFFATVFFTQTQKNIPDQIQNKVFTSPKDSTVKYILYNHQQNIKEVASSKHTLTIISDFEIEVLYFFNEEDIDTAYVFLDDTTTVYNISLQEGSYSILGSRFKTDHQLQIYYLDNVLLYTDTSLFIYEEDIVHTNEYSFTREDFRLVRINFGHLTFLFPDKILGVDQYIGFGYMKGLMDSTSFLISYNDLPIFLTNEWVLQGRNRVNENLYLFNGLIEGHSLDTMITTNDINNLSYVDFNYFFEDSILLENIFARITTYQPSGNQGGWPNKSLSAPYRLRVYQDRTNPDTLYHSRFSQRVIAYGTRYISPLKRIYNDRIEYYKSPEYYDYPFIFRTKDILCGITPVFWNGRFKNISDSIRIEAPFGLFSHDYLFLSQSLDAINQSPFKYYLFKNGIEINKGVIGSNPLFYVLNGAYFDTLDYSVEPDKYKYLIINENVEVAGIAGGVLVEADFDLRNEDKNPPYLEYFQITENDIITNEIHSFENTKIRFKAFDDFFINDVRLKLESLHLGNTYDLDVIETSPSWYEAKLPILPNNIYVLDFTISDSSNNSIYIYMEPVFVVDAITNIKEVNNTNNSLKVVSVYPNPFNSQTKIAFEVENQDINELEINIIDILGKEVKSYKGPFNAGENIITWYGKNNQNENVSSGIYFVLMKGGGERLLKKCIILR